LTSTSDHPSDASEPSGEAEATANAEPDDAAPGAADDSPPAEAETTEAVKPAAKSGAQPAWWRRFFLMEERLREAEAKTFRPSDPGYPQFDMARRALDGVDTLLEVADRQDGALLLLREAAVLAVRARLARERPEAAAALARAGGAQLWDELASLEQTGKLLAGLEQDERSGAEQAIREGDSARYAELGKDERKAHLRALRKLVPALVDDLRGEANRLAEVRVVRRLRIGGAIVVLALLVVGVVYGLRSIGQDNMALGKPVTLSSYYKKDKFPPAQLVDGNPETIGGHTRKQSKPWAQIDLQSVRTIQKIVVTNRLDQFDRYGKRAFPLRIETSTDGKKYDEFARQNKSFTVWNATGAPVQARYIRLTALKTTELHLNEVEAY